MQLSMWILYSELEKYDRVSSIQGGEPHIEGIRLFSDGCSIAAEAVYIGNCSEFFGTNAEDVILAHRHDYILLKGAAQFDVINSVIEIFDKYRIWGERLNSAMSSAKPFQEILNIAHEALSCPMFFGQKNMRIVATTGKHAGEQYFDEWDTITQYRVIPASMLDRLRHLNLPEKYPEDIDPAVLPTTPGMREHQYYDCVIRVACKYNGELWGHLFAFVKSSHALICIQQLLKVITAKFELLLDLLPEVRNGYHYCKELVEALDGKSIVKEDVDRLYNMFKWSGSTPLQVYKITPSGEAFDEMLFDSVCTSIADYFSDDIVFPYRESIIIVAKRDVPDKSSLIDALGSFLLLGVFSCGRSLSFQGLENIAAYCEQAELVIKVNKGSKKRIHYFEDCAYTSLVEAFSAGFDWKCWVHPSLLHLRDMDVAQNTEYYKTLCIFLKNKGHYGNTVKDLYIHRNTLTYRLAKIESILNVDIYNESVSAYLRFCYELATINGIAFPVQNKCRKSGG